VQSVVPFAGIVPLRIDLTTFVVSNMSSFHSATVACSSVIPIRQQSRFCDIDTDNLFSINFDEKDSVRQLYLFNEYRREISEDFLLSRFDFHRWLSICVCFTKYLSKQ